MIFDSAPESIINQFQDLVVEILYFLGFPREMELSKFFFLGVLLVFFGICDLWLNFVLYLCQVELPC